MRPPFLRDAISVEPYAGSGAQGPTYGTAVSYKATVQPREKLIIDTRGKQVMSVAFVIVRPNAVIPVESRVTASDGRVFRVLMSHVLPDIARPTHLELSLGSLNA